ncbi:Coiled-coil domain-containing protein 86 [Eumeta japonica]|uniref:Coiled-coil domain-containing protein 86 n=1 Tax=Eumeta variegata TaxID=151549 RepID=A0A4C1VT87_EUMVA|nr:Coiled-coil domain-containing protein 86 [Eumeta japonica]
MAETTHNQVISIVDNLKKSAGNSENTLKSLESNDAKNDLSSVASKKKDKKPIENTIRGKPKSGKFWKERRDKFSSINKTKGLKQSFKKKTALREEYRRVRELSKQALEELKQKQIQRKERRKENIKRAEEKQRKAEIVQVITNTAKLKRMRKKQLRFIQKRDTNETVEKNK